jgi:hypothetical protein
MGMYGKFPSGLIYCVKDTLQALGHTVKVIPRGDVRIKGKALPVSFTGQLRPYQQEAVEAVLKTQTPHGIIAVAVRGGKTVIAAAIIARLKYAPVLFLCERLDIAKQTIRVFEEFLSGVSIGWIMDSEVKKGDIIISTVQSAAIAFKYDKKLPKTTERLLGEKDKEVALKILQETKLLMLDECFPAGTLIDGIPIESLNIGDYVNCYDHEKEEITKRKITHVFKKKTDELAVIKLTNGKEIVCTPNHPIYTLQGYKKAGILSSRDMVLTTNNSEVYINESKNMCRVRERIYSKKQKQQECSYLFKRLKKVLRSCTICGKEVLLQGQAGLEKARKENFYCSKECTSKAFSKTMAETNRKYASERMKRNNPMHNPETRAKVSTTLRAMGWKPSVRGGNGELTIPQTLLACALGWDTEVAVTTHLRDCGYPSCYKLDVANKDLKIGIEIDGFSHQSLERKELDKKKEECLHLLGWRVLRFWNEEVLQDLSSCVQKVLSTI